MKFVLDVQNIIVVLESKSKKSSFTLRIEILYWFIPSKYFFNKNLKHCLVLLLMWLLAPDKALIAAPESLSGNSHPADRVVPRTSWKITKQFILNSLIALPYKSTINNTGGYREGKAKLYPSRRVLKNYYYDSLRYWLSFSAFLPSFLARPRSAFQFQLSCTSDPKTELITWDLSDVFLCFAPLAYNRP